MDLLIQINFNLSGADCIFRRTSDSDEAGNQVLIRKTEKEIRLTAKEFDILELLLKNPGKVFSREELLSVSSTGRNAFGIWQAK